MIQQGYLILADVSGYTAFLTQTELEHAREILDALLTTLLESFTPPLIVSKLEGDAVLAYTLSTNFLQGQTLLEALERIYFAFRLTRDNIHRACHCQACTLTSSLDLKFVVHYGQFTLQQLGHIQELQGTDVIVAHRLLKNDIVKMTGVRTYALFTEASARAIPLGDLIQGMAQHTETYEHLGAVPVYVHDMARAWEDNRERRQVQVGPSDAWIILEFELPVSPALAWEYLNNPQCICEWCGLASVQPIDLKWGRIGIGSGRHCVHAKSKAVTVETILDYEPFNYVTVQASQANGISLRTTTKVIPADPTYSRIAWYAARPTGKTGLSSLLVRSLLPILKIEILKELQTSSTKLKALVAADLAAGKITNGAG